MRERLRRDAKDARVGGLAKKRERSRELFLDQGNRIPNANMVRRAY